jgi:hypothetical protein
MKMKEVRTKAWTYEFEKTSIRKYTTATRRGTDVGVVRGIVCLEGARVG